MKYNKPNVMLDTLQRLHTGSSCEDKYVVYLDIDVYLVDLNQKIEDLIKNGNIESTRECHLLAQDAPTTINTGVLIFKVSSFSIEFIKKWIKLQRWYTIYEKIKWQDEFTLCIAVFNKNGEFITIEREVWYEYKFPLFKKRVILDTIDISDTK
jgi:hypothetical protein